MMKSMWILSGTLFLVLLSIGISQAEQAREHDGWSQFSLREEIRPEFDVRENPDSSTFKL